MRDFSITEQDIAISRARWEPEFCAFAQRSTKQLSSCRRLPIYTQAATLAAEWINTHIASAVVPGSRSLLLIGDEHLAAAASAQLRSADVQYTHIFPEAWVHWLYTEFRGNPGWWVTFGWAINNPVRLLHLAEFGDTDLALQPNETYLLSVAYGSRGTDSICQLENGRLVIGDPYCKWADSV